MGNKLYNLKFAVKNLEESVAFYKNVFKPLGFSGGKYYDDPIDEKKTVVIGNEHLYMELIEEPLLVSAYDLSSIKGPRIEFLASCKEEVDNFYNHLVENKVKILSEPQYMFSELLEGEDDFWYAVYFADVNGLKYGLVYTTK